MLTRRSQLTAPTSKYPICYIEGTTINILPGIASVASVNGSPAQVYNLEYVKKPADPSWAFTVGTVGQYLYDSGNSVNFEISDLDQSELILKSRKVYPEKLLNLGFKFTHNHFDDIVI